MTTKAIDEIYHILGNMLYASVNKQYKEYKEAFCEVQRTPGMVQFNGYCIDMEGKKKSIDDMHLDRETSAHVHKLHELTTKGSRFKWNKLLLKLKASNEFKIDFINDKALEEEMAAYMKDQA